MLPRSPHRWAGMTLGRSTSVRRWLHPPLSALLPSSCVACLCPLDALHLHGCCAPCWASLRALRPPQCHGCGLPLPGSSDLGEPARGRCPRCRSRRSPIDRVVAAVEYDRRARSILLRAKLGRRPEILHDLALQLAAAIRASGAANDCDLVVAAPSHPWTNLRRGFVPAFELARCVASQLCLPFRHVLRRRLFPWGSAKTRRFRGRRRLLRHAVYSRCPLAGARPLLVDDVMTTGATAEACAGALRDAGCFGVVSGTWARTLPPVLRSHP